MRALVVQDLGFGDAGKGSIVDYLAREHQAELVVFYNGGAQRAHNVVTDDGRHHTFAQFGSGTLAGARTFHSRHSLVNPLNFVVEGNILRTKGITDPFALVEFDARCPVVTRFHQAANRIRELSRGDQRHGSCGQGIGETAYDAERGLGITLSDLLDYGLERKLLDIQERKSLELDMDCRGWTGLESAEVRWVVDDTTIPEVANHLRHTARSLVITDKLDLGSLRNVIFEGSQGVLLDGDYGFDPFTTWSNCTFDNANAILAEYDADVTRIGVTRGYGVRHGPGPFPTEARDLGLGDPHNTTGPWQGPLRCGYTDLVLLRYALDVLDGIDTLAVTCLDQLPKRNAAWQMCTGYRWPAEQLPVTRIHHNPRVVRHRGRTHLLQNCEPVYDTCFASEVPHIISEVLGVPIGITSSGPTAEQKLTHAVTLD